MIRVIHGAWQALEWRQAPLEGFWRRERCFGTMLCHVCLCRQGRRGYTVCTIQSIKDHFIYEASDPFISVGQRRRADFMNYSYGVYLCAHYISRLTCVNLSPPPVCITVEKCHSTQTAHDHTWNSTGITFYLLYSQIKSNGIYLQTCTSRNTSE